MKLTDSPLRWSVPGLILAVGLVALGGLYWVELRGSFARIEDLAMSQVRTLGLITASDIESALRRGDASSAQRSLERARADHNLQRAALVGPRGRILASTHFLDRGRPIGDTPFAPGQALLDSAAARGRSAVEFEQQGDLILGVFAVRLTDTAEPHMPDRSAVLLTLHSLEVPRMLARQDARQRLGAAALVLAIFCGLLWLVIRRLLLSRIQSLIEATETIAGGHFDAPIRVEGADELRSLADSLARMAHRLATGERDLREKEEHYRSIIESMEDVVSIIGADMVYEYVSPSTERISGFKPEWFHGRSVFTGILPEEAAAMKDGFDRLLRGEERHIEYETRFTQADGTEAIYHTVCRPLDAPGRPRRLLGVSRNVTELRRAAAALQESEERFNSLFASLTDGAWAASADGTEFLYGNEALSRIYGRAFSEFSGNPKLWIDVVAPEDRQIARESMRRLAETGAAESEYRIVRPGGEIRWIRERKQLIRDKDGRVLRMGGLVTDITEARKAQEERQRLESQLRQTQKMEAIGTLAGGVAHDFNNLLTAINGYADLLLDALGEQHELAGEVREIRAAGERAAALTRQLLLFSRQDVVQPRKLDLNALVRNLGRMLTRLIGEHIEYEAHLGEERLEVRADPGQIEQILLNLVVNARDAMESGGRLDIRTERVQLDPGDLAVEEQLTPGPYARLSVTDTGCGMSEETQSRIFEPFFTTKEVGKGTGLGLSTLYGIVRQCRGAIRVRSRVGEGSTFEVLLPLVGEGTETPDEPDRSRPLPGGHETILFVEDERVVREVGSRMLRQHGYQVIEAADGSEALEVARQLKGRIDLVVSDVVMPRMTGRALASRLLELYPELRVLFVSGYTERAAGENLPMAENLPYLQKPYSPVSLTAKVREVLDGQPARAALRGTAGNEA